MEKYNRVAVGGTFDKFHYGHRSLIAKAFEIGKSVEIGVTSNAFAGLKEGDIDPCEVRMTNLNNFLEGDHENFHISRLDDAYGPTVVDPDFDAIVVSEETGGITASYNNEYLPRMDAERLERVLMKGRF